MQSFTGAICNQAGLHARPAAVFVKTASRFQSTITISNATTASQAVNAKSILLVLTLGVEQGHKITVAADGVDEAEALAALRQCILDRCDEAE